MAGIEKQEFQLNLTPTLALIVVRSASPLPPARPDWAIGVRQNALFSVGLGQTNAEFYNKARSDGRVGHYGWSNGRFVGNFINSGARFEGKWVQDKSGKRYGDRVNGNYYHGKMTRLTACRTRAYSSTPFILRPSLLSAKGYR